MGPRHTGSPSVPTKTELRVTVLPHEKGGRGESLERHTLLSRGIERHVLLVLKVGCVCFAISFDLDGRLAQSLLLSVHVPVICIDFEDPFRRSQIFE